MTAKVSKRKFKSELSQILHIITHSLYSHSEIFLRELISNASDAIDKVRFEGLNNDSLLENNKDWKIKLIVDVDAGTLTVSDNGIGMSKDAIIENLGTIAKSGTKAFLESMEESKEQSLPELIGQFGVGFYSAFMVADKVSVYSRLAGDSPDTAVKWTSDGQGEYSVQDFEKESRGTDIVLHLKDDSKEYLDAWKLREVVKQFSDFIEHPVVMDVERGEEGEKKLEEETLNSRAALWLRDKSEIEVEEYNQFYRQITNNFTDPAKVIHYTGEGFSEFNVLLFIPSTRPFEMQFGEMKIGPKLYINRVLIMDNCEELMPPYLRFVKGVVDCPDLPLNVSREILQDNPKLARIQKNIVKNVLKSLKEMKDENFDEYVKFYEQLGDVIKEGLANDFANRDEIAELLLFQSINTNSGEYTTLAKYVEQMPEEQEEIFYLTGESRKAIENAPYLEVFKERGWDVLLLTDPVDEFVLPHFPEYQEKKLKAADKGDLAAGEGSQENTSLKEEFLPLLESLRTKIAEVKEVRLSTRLKESASCLVSEEGAIGAHMERLLKNMNQGEEIPESERILELNPEHAVVLAMKSLFSANPEDSKIENYGKLLYDQAVIAEGSKLDDPADFVKRINELVMNDAGDLAKE
jgi:molecular chaperone HtpG